MSYLDFPRIHFAGQFQADVSTVNNDPHHFDNQDFVPQDQKLPTANSSNGWWNPGGTGYWRLKNVTVTAACYASGPTVVTDPSIDWVIGTPLTGAEDRVAAKIVDLDSQNQQVSELWGFQINLGNMDGGNAFQGTYKVSALDDLWFARVPSHTGDSAASAYYQSVLYDLKWSDHVDSTILLELKDAAQKNGNMLSIRFTVDGFNGDYNTENFSYGRIVGEIGPYYQGEPKHFVAGRYLRPISGAPVSLYYTPAKVTHYASHNYLLVDLSNSVPAQSPGGDWIDIGNLHMAVQDSGSYRLLGTINYKQPGWYIQKGGIESYLLTHEIYHLVQQNPLAVVQVTDDGAIIPLLQENEIGSLARSDYFVYRLDPQSTNGLPSPAHYWPSQVDVVFYAFKLATS